MTSLQQHVADAIAQAEECGGKGILCPDEEEALRWAMGQAHLATGINGAHCAAIGRVLADLGPHPLFVVERGDLPGDDPREDRVNDYYLKCATIAIRAYDEWVEQRHRAAKAVPE